MSRQEYINVVVVVSVILIAQVNLVMFWEWLRQQWWFVPAVVLIIVAAAILVWFILHRNDHSRRGMM